MGDFRPEPRDAGLRGARHPRRLRIPPDLPRQSPRGDALGDHPGRGPPVRARRALRRGHPGPRPRGRGDDGGHDDDREPQRDLRLLVRSRADDRELDRQQLHGGGAARTECADRTGTRPHADVPRDQHLRPPHGPPGDGSRGGRMTFLLERDTWRYLKDIVMSVAALACVVLALIPLGSILIEAAGRGLQAISPSFFVLNTGEGGIGNAIQGTLILIALTSLIALPVGVLTGIYLSEFGKNRVGFAIRFFVEVMTQIPSIIVGIFAYSVILELGLLHVVDTRLVFSTTTGVIALSTIMVPFVARAAEEALRLVPVATRESALALGIPQYRTILRVVLPYASSALLTGALLGVARIGGETAPLLMTAFGSPFWFSGLDHPIESLPHTIYVFALSPSTAQNQAAWGASLILVLIMLVISITSRSIVRLRSVSG